MQQSGRTYIAIDLKSFYASVECMERGLDPLTTNLVVADASRTEKTICLAVSPSLKAYGISGRARLFEVVERVKEVNAERRHKAGGELSEKSFNANELAADPSREVDYLIAPPRMAKYIQISTQVYNVYLKYIAPEDIHVYSIDEVMMDVTNYLQTYHMTARELAKVMISDVLHTTGITATAGIGSNLYLCKVAMDIMAKHVQPDKDGVRIAALDEMSYREQLWDHRPLTDFWRVGRGYAKKLEAISIYTMGDVARCSIGKPNEYYNEELLYRMFGINAELLIDHAWGWEPCRMQDIKAYRPETNSICSGQVLQCPYSFEKARLVVREMAEAVALDLLEKKLVTDQLTLTVGYPPASNGASIKRCGRERQISNTRPCWDMKRTPMERWWSTQSRRRLSERFTSCTYPVRRCAISRKPWKRADSRIRQERRNGQPPICGRSSLMKNTAVTSCSRRPSFETASASRSSVILDSFPCI